MGRKARWPWIESGLFRRGRVTISMAELESRIAIFNGRVEHVSSFYDAYGVVVPIVFELYQFVRGHSRQAANFRVKSLKVTIVRYY